LDDQPPLIHDQWVALHARRIDGEKLQQIDAALERIDQSEFGVCKDCGGEIACRRLEAIAWAAYCLHCQERVIDAASNEFHIDLAAA